MKSIEVFISSGSPALEGRLELPDLPPPFPGVIICHPHPLHGGNMNNNVVTGVGYALVQKGFAVLRFNFRGVGRSEGAFDEGIGEQDDARACLKFLREREEIDPGRIGLAGYSFGGMIALSVGVREDAVRVMAGISPVMPKDILRGCNKPKIIISGTYDDVVPVSLVSQETEKAGEHTEIRVIDGADHFWWGFERQLGEMVAAFFADNFNNAGEQ